MRIQQHELSQSFFKILELFWLHLPYSALPLNISPYEWLRLTQKLVRSHPFCNTVSYFRSDNKQLRQSTYKVLEWKSTMNPYIFPFGTWQMFNLPCHTKASKEPSRDFDWICFQRSNAEELQEAFLHPKAVEILLQMLSFPGFSARINDENSDWSGIPKWGFLIAW